MTIDAYSFGNIVIDGKAYSHDVIISPDGSVSRWWRRKGHVLSIEDLTEVLEKRPRTLVIGTGASGGMTVPAPVVHELEAQGIEMIVERTRDACGIFNELAGEGVWAAFHLTC